MASSHLANREHVVLLGKATELRGTDVIRREDCKTDGFECQHVAGSLGRMRFTFPTLAGHPLASTTASGRRWCQVGCLFR
jgi:hypothetical protein